VSDGERLQQALIEALPTPVVLVDDRRQVVQANKAAHRALDTLPRTCCEFACGTGCLTRMALSVGTDTPLVHQIDSQGTRWNVAARTLPGYRLVVLQLTPVHAPVSPESDVLDVSVLGGLRISKGGLPLDGAWLEHRPGQVLKYLLAARGRTATVDELVDALWPQTGSSGAAVASVRQAVHALRGRLEPEDRAPGTSSFILSRRGGYALDETRLRVDADEFERAAQQGLSVAEHHDWERAEPALRRAAELYRGDLLADDRFADWALTERERLRAIAMQVLRTLADAELHAGELQGANERLERLAELEPLDLATQRDLLSLMLKRGRHSDAARRYEMVRHRYRRTFGEEPGFKLAELAPRR
jgi:DNA-binding SARP family transcriptional activator